MTKNANDVYMDTVNRMEPEIHAIDECFSNASISISLKRIADALEKMTALQFASFSKSSGLTPEEDLTILLKVTKMVRAIKEDQ